MIRWQIDANTSLVISRVNDEKVKFEMQEEIEVEFTNEELQELLELLAEL